MADLKLIEEIAAGLKEKDLTLAAVESATGGLISYHITGLPGSSEFFKGAVVSYSNEVKTNVVGVSAETIYEHGAVSPQVAEAMAAGGRKLLGADICIADTGIAGPGGATEAKPVGLVHLACARAGAEVRHQRRLYEGTRAAVRLAAVETALEMLLASLES